MLKMVPNCVLRPKRILNVAQRLRLRFSLGSGLVGNHFEPPPILIISVLKIARQLRSQLAAILTLPAGKERVWARLGRVGEKVYASGLVGRL
jgi:hypothetical protein